MIEGVSLTPLAIVPHPDGDILHAIRSDSVGFDGFGEAYFSTVHRGHVKAWKRHRLMTLNIVVPTGSIRFAIHDDRPDSATAGATQAVVLARDNYCRLTIRPGLWVGFQGIGEGLNLLLNVANLPHDPAEADRLAPDAIDFDWGLK